MPRIKILPKYQGTGPSQVTSTTTINLADFNAVAGAIFGSPGFKRARALGIKPGSMKTTGNEGTWPATTSQTTTAQTSTAPTLSGPVVVQTSTTTKSPYGSFFDSFKSGYSFGSNSFGRKLQNFDTGLNIFNAVANQFDIRRKQKEFDAKMRESMLPDNTYAVNTKVDRGDWEVNDGIFRPDRMGFKSKGTLTNPQYASTNFVRYGGLIKAADGMLVQGDQIVNKAFLPDVNAADAFIGASPVQMQSSSAPSLESSSSVDADYSNQDYVLPVENFKITSGFGHRKAPTSKSSSNHNGLDLAVPENTNVRSIKDGVIYKMWEDGNGGKQMLIKHDDGSVSGYAHLNSYNFKLNDRVRKGQNVALSGNTGTSTGPHLHFTYRPNLGSNVVDPRDYLNFDLSGNKTRKLNNVGIGNGQINFTHNNPLNVHYGKFASNYGALSGADDAGGKVARFPDLQTGIRANKDLLFGPNYNTLTISQARNKWVSGNPNISNSSTSAIVKAMGGDKRIADLSPQEKDKLFKEFARWEGSQGYNAIKNMYLFEEGGQNNNNMKIRIVGHNHMAKGGQPQYSGQSDYGLYIGQRNLYSSMPEDPFKSPTNTVKEEEATEENPHVLEAEGGGKNKVGETILRPDGTHNFIVGDRHSTGGVKLNKKQAPPGSFIYSDTGKMTIRNPKILEHFGKSGKKGVTPAQIAKQYDVNKFLAILKDPYADALQKQTAMRMVENYQIKLAELALIQEGIKGYPQGVPEVAKGIVSPEQQAQIEQQRQQKQQGGAQGMPMQRFGGVPRFAGGGPGDPYDPEFKKTIEWMTDYEQEGSSKGKKGYVGGGDNWGTNNPNIKTKEDAIKYYHENYWPMVKDLPPGLRSRALQLAVNTGDPYGEMLVASGKMTVEDRIKAVREADAKGLKGLEKNKYILEKRKKENQADIDATINTFKQDPKAYMTKLDAEQDRYYNKGLQGVNDAQRNFLSGYYKGVGNISNEFITPSNQNANAAPNPTTSVTTNSATAASTTPASTTNDPLGKKDMIVNSGANATVRVTKAPLVGQTRNTAGQEEAWDGTNWIPKADYEKKFLNTTDPSKNVGAAQSPASAQQYNMPNWFKLWTKSNTLKGRTSPKGRTSTYDESQAPKDHIYKGYQYWRDRAGRDFTGPRDFQKYVFGELEKYNPSAIKYIMDEWGQTAAGKLDDDIFGARTTYAMQQQIPVATTTQPVIPTETTTQPPAVTPTTTKPPGGKIPVPTTTMPPPVKKIPPRGKWTSQDARDFGNAIADYATLRKYHPRRTPVQPVLPEFIPVDWRGMAASLQSSQNAAANQIGTYQGGNAMGANLSFLQGQTGNQLGQYISQTDQYNAAGATAKDSERAGILNQFTLYNAQNVDKNWDEENVYDDRYRRAEREARKGIVKTWNQGEHNASKIFNLNQTEKYFNIDPWTQKMYFKDDAARAAWEAETRGGPQPGEDEAWAARYSALMNDKNLAMIPEDERREIINKRLTGSSSGSIVKNQRKTDDKGNVSTVNTVTTQQDDDNVTTPTQRYGGSFKKGGSIAFVKAVDDWYKKLNYIADPEERQRVALAYARVMES